MRLSAVLLLFALIPAPAQTPRTAARQAFERGVQMESEGRLEEAHAAYSEAIRSDPSLFAAWRARGALNLKRKRYDEAAEDLQSALRLIEGHLEALRLLEEARSAAVQPPAPAEPPPPPQPAEFPKPAPVPTPKPAPAAGEAELRHRAGRAAIQAGKLDEALKELTAAVEMDPRHALAWNARGYVHLLLGQPEKALADFNRALEVNPDYQNALVNRSEARRRLGDAKGAAGDAARARALSGKR